MTAPLAVAITRSFLAQLLLSGVLAGSVYALLGTSFNVIYATTRRFHFAHALVYTMAAYGAVVAQANWGAPLWAAALFGLATSVVLGVLIELGPYAALARHGASGLAIFIASLGLTIAGTNIFQAIFGAEPRTLPGFPIETINIGSVTLTNLNLIAAVASLAFVGALITFLRVTRFGTAIRAVQVDPDVARAVGIAETPVHVAVFALGSLLMGIGGLFFAMSQVAEPTMGSSPILIALIAAFIGGIGSTLGAAVGGLAVGLATNLGQLWISSDMTVVLVFGLLFAFLIVRPRGLFGRINA